MYQTRLTLKTLLLGLLFAFAVVAAPVLSGPAHAGYEGQEEKAKAITLGQPDFQTQEKSLHQPNFQTQEKDQRQPNFQTQGVGGRDDAKAKAITQGQPDFQTQEVSQRDPNFQTQEYDWSDD